jgi:putative ABC transport system substrate-binding protein
LFALPLAAGAQHKAKVFRLGFLNQVSGPGPAMTTLMQGLRELGWIEGENLAIEVRYADGKFDRLPSLAAELVHLKVDVMVPLGPPAVRAAAQATKTIPIVITGGIDPIASGLVTNLARPGGNITGISSLSAETATKRLEMLKQIAPRFKRVGVFWDPGEPEEAAESRALEPASRALGFELVSFPASTPAAVEKVFAAHDGRRVDALFNVGSLGPPRFRARPILELSAKHRIPAVFGWPGLIEDGGLLSYNIDFDEIFRRAATHIHKILNGARPGDLPIEQPTKFQLVVNIKAAKAYGLTVPPALLLRADRVVE